METKFNQLKDYFKANPGTPFIVAFMALLLSAAVLLASAKPNEANILANYAFYSLVLGIAIQVGVVAWEERKNSHRRDNNRSDSS
jgi:hypothetical protein